MNGTVVFLPYSHKYVFLTSVAAILHNKLHLLLYVESEQERFLEMTDKYIAALKKPYSLRFGETPEVLRGCGAVIWGMLTTLISI